MKMNIRKKLVSLAVASAVSGGAMVAMTAPVHAMNISQNNMGQVLLFPYYTVKNGLDTVFTVTNTSDMTLAIKVRWREALNSREVRDFNVVLSPNDHWSAGVTDNGTGGALVRTFDKSCTSPILPNSTTVSGAREVGFTNVLFSGSANDGASSDISRVQEGYFEVFLMGTSTRDTSVSSNVLEYNAKHVNGVPRDCAKVDALFLNVGQNLSYMSAPENVLKGHVIYINVNNGTAMDAEPTAIEDFQTLNNIVYPPSDLLPDLGSGDASADILWIYDGQGYGVNFSGGSSSYNAVTGLLAASSVVNEFATGAGASTSWVVTFPTKHHYTDKVGPINPFQQRFDQTLANGNKRGKSCDDIEVTLFNREEGTAAASGTSFSPAVPGETAQLCYEANVIDFNNSSVFGSGTNRLSIATGDVGTAGWARLSFTSAAAQAGVSTCGGQGNCGDTLAGLPVIGFSATVRDNGSATVNYGSSEQFTTEKSYTGGQGPI
jgi:hypothetical protein